LKSGSDPDFLQVAAKVFGYLAAIFLAAMMLLTVADVALRAVFNKPIHGTFELIELCLACTIFLALPAVFLRDEHLVVDVVDHFARPAVVKVLDLFGAIASLAVLAVMFWQMVPLARDMQEFGDVTADLSIPKIFYWVPVLLGVGASALATLVLIARWRR
jgi:TRAP-type C4-dicarboxylate transport system permease small subunit